MRITRLVVEAKASRINKNEKLIHLCQRNGYWAIDSADSSNKGECYFCGMSTKEAYTALKGILIGIRLKEDKNGK